MIKLEPETIAQFEKYIIPEIKGAAEDCLRAYEQGARPDGSNNFDNYMLGCSCWNNVYNRLNRELEQHPFFFEKNLQKSSCYNLFEWQRRIKLLRFTR